MIPRGQYERQVRATRAARMDWWKQARFGMFVHLGLYSVIGRHESALATECIPMDEYERLADRFRPRPGAPREWARLARRAGMKYMVFTTKHSEGYCLWDTRLTDFNSVRSGPRRDLVAEFTEACREEGLGVGFYYPLEDLRHPDCARMAYDPDARHRFLAYNRESLRELMTRYGRVDILFYDSPDLLRTGLAWEGDAQNQMIREWQPHILINDRLERQRDPSAGGGLLEDFSTPEGKVELVPSVHDRGWEACMTFNNASWGHMTGAEVDAWRGRDIVKMLGKACAGQGNLLLNIGPPADGSVPPEAVEPLETAGRWLARHAEAVYGRLDSFGGFPSYCGLVTRKANVIYFWRQIWAGREQGLGGYKTALRSVTCLTTGLPVRFEQDGWRIRLLDLPERCPDPDAGIAVYRLEFAEEPVFKWLPTTPAVTAGWPP